MVDQVVAQSHYLEEFRASPGCDVARFNSRRSDRGGTAAVREGGAATVSVMNSKKKKKTGRGGYGNLSYSPCPI